MVSPDASANSTRISPSKRVQALISKRWPAKVIGTVAHLPSVRASREMSGRFIDVDPELPRVFRPHHRLGINSRRVNSNPYTVGHLPTCGLLASPGNAITWLDQVPFDKNLPLVFDVIGVQPIRSPMRAQLCLECRDLCYSRPESQRLHAIGSVYAHCICASFQCSLCSCQ